MILQKDTGTHIVYSDGRIWHKRLNRFLSISTHDRSEKTYYAVHYNGRCLGHHRIIAECFIPNPNNYPHINHINGNGLDNRIENLEWCTSGQNQKHAYKLGLRKSLAGSENPYAKLTDEKVRMIRECLKAGFGVSKIAKYYKVWPGTISAIKTGARWGHLV